MKQKFAIAAVTRTRSQVRFLCCESRNRKFLWRFWTSSGQGCLPSEFGGLPTGNGVESWRWCFLYTLLVLIPRTRFVQSMNGSSKSDGFVHSFHLRKQIIIQSFFPKDKKPFCCCCYTGYLFHMKMITVILCTGYSIGKQHPTSPTTQSA